MFICHYPVTLPHPPSYKLRTGLVKQIKASPGTDVDILTWFSRTALELIGQGGLGCSLDPLDSHDATPYGTAMKSFVYVGVPLLTTSSIKLFVISPALNPFAAAQFALPYLRYFGTRRFRGWLFGLIPSSSAKRFRSIIETMDSESRRIYTIKKTALESGDDSAVQEVGEGKDIMSVLCKCAADIP